MSFDKKWFILIMVIVALLGISLGSQIFETVPAGEYQICQNILTGTLSAKMKPGPYWQMFGRIYKYPVADTFYFTNDSEGGKGDYSIHVQFVDGSTCDISGTCRVEYPKTDLDAISLLSEHGFRNADDVEDRLILPVIRRSLMMSANFITAKESYSDKRAEFVSDAWDQIENGVYATQDREVKEFDVSLGREVTRIRKTRLLDKSGAIVREKNPLQGLGVKLTNFEIKKFVYSEGVTKQISVQQDAMMSVQTAKVNAQKSEQEAIAAEALGKANVMKSKYEKEQEKIKAVVSAEQEKEVAETIAAKEKSVALMEASKKFEVAERDRQTAEIKLKIAELEKKALIEKAEGEAAFKEKVFKADGGLIPKLEAYCKVNDVWAHAFKERKTPSVVMGLSNQTTDSDASTFMQILGIKAANDLALDFEIDGKKNTNRK